VKSPAARAASFQVGQRLRELEILTIQCRLLTRILLSTGQGVQMLVGRARDYRVSDVHKSSQASCAVADDARLQLTRELNDTADGLRQIDLVSPDGRSPLSGGKAAVMSWRPRPRRPAKRLIRARRRSRDANSGNRQLMAVGNRRLR
jgi:hypothetical protein